MITGAQCRAARALVELSRERLASLAGVEEDTIRMFEMKLSEPDAETIAAVEAALERAGAVFIAENGGGAGVRLKFTRAETKRLSMLEGEGGIAALDDVP